jgi:hypothetical protein
MKISSPYEKNKNIKLKNFFKSFLLFSSSFEKTNKGVILARTIKHVTAAQAMDFTISKPTMW